MGSTIDLRVVFLLATLLLVACGELTPPDERSSSYAYSLTASSYTVRPGDTLYSIAWGAGLDVREVASWNRISPPYTIYPGQRILLTEPGWHRPTSRADEGSSASLTSNPKTGKSSGKKAPKASSTRGSLVKPRHISPHGASQQHKSAKSAPTAVENSSKTPISSVRGWSWPAKGRVINRFDAASGRKGIDIGGRAGQEIFTAAAGDVVYSGNGLLGYGNLLIIKHDDTYLSAYGHNSQLLVKEGDKVTAGQKIAEMGMSPKEGAILHFEIRKEGKPVDPLAYLPK